MIHSRSLSRELALLVLGQISENEIKIKKEDSIDYLLNCSIEMLLQHWQEGLDKCAGEIDKAHQELQEIELLDSNRGSLEKLRQHLQTSLISAELILNGISASLELPRLLALSDQVEIKQETLKRIKLVIQKRSIIDPKLDGVMEGWRLKRLPRIDRDILRLACVDLVFMKTPPAVACSEAVELANRYSDEQGRRMINGVLRRFQDSSLKLVI